MLVVQDAEGVHETQVISSGLRRSAVLVIRDAEVIREIRVVSAGYRVLVVEDAENQVIWVPGFRHITAIGVQGVEEIPQKQAPWAAFRWKVCWDIKVMTLPDVDLSVSLLNQSFLFVVVLLCLHVFHRFFLR